MGNQLSGIAPSQILSVDHYFSDLSDFEFDQSLGSTRFFKVARAKYKEGLCVVKVFAIQDPSLPLKSYQDELNNIKNKLISAPNVLPFSKSILTDKASLLLRQYVKDNLYDRISTRPFLNQVEKKWIVYQLLCALDQCHTAKVCHGDIKTENVMVTSWNWVLLTDLASVKPVYLPEDNPADFNFFFDTSRRRSCYIAPERFLDFRQSENSDSQLNLPDIDLANHQRGELTPAMDIFSAGCVIAELFSEGTRLFDLSELLAYRNGTYDPNHHITEKIEDQHIRELVQNMIAKDPKKRLSAAEYIQNYRGNVFPEQFYTFLETYMSKFAGVPVLTADEKIRKIKKDIMLILDKLGSAEQSEEHADHRNGSLVIVVSLLTSCLRSCKYCVSKLTVLELLLFIGRHLSDETILERLLPYMLYLVNDTLPQVRAQALRTVTQCLKLIKSIPRSDANIFPEYILQSLAWLTQDTEVIVRIAYAENIASLAETALKFLEMAQLDYGIASKEAKEDAPIQYQGSYDGELQALHELIQRKVVTLLSDSENIVKQTLLENGITRLCVFFGRQKANDVLLSHMITFLNDKQDWQLRGAFFDSIVGVAAYVGWQSLAMLRPLLEQGLSDVEEFVVCKALNALTCLAELGLLQKPAMHELVVEVVSFLCHPNMWVRYGAVGFIAAVARTLNVADVHCNLLPQLQPFLKQPVVQVDKEVILVSLMKEPISRSVYDFIIKSPLTPDLFDCLQHRQLMRNVCRVGHHPNYPEYDERLKPIFRKLHSQGITEPDEDKLLSLKGIILKLHRAKMSAIEHARASEDVVKGEIDLKVFGKSITKRHADLIKAPEGKTDSSSNKKGNTKNKKSVTTDSRETSQSEKSELLQPPSVNTLPRPVVKDPPQDQSKSQLVRQMTVEQLHNAKQARYAGCKLELRNLVGHKRDHYASDLKTKALVGGLLTEGNKPKQQRWHPKGQLVAHLHEHRASINRLQVSPDNSCLATASDDGSVKLWDMQKLDGKSLINKSRQTYSRPGYKMKSVVFCQGSSSIACASEEDVIHVFRIEQNPQQPPAKLQVFQKKVSPKEEGHVVDLTFFDTGSQSILTYATTHGLICAWDLRCASSVWKLENNPIHGLITSVVVDPCNCWLTAGTSSGTLVCWDLRFQLPITDLAHPRGARVRRLASHPSEQSWVVSAVQGNNEVSMWDLETGARRQALWASNAPPLSQTQVSPQAVHALCTSPPDSSPFIVTAGSDRRIRLWDLAIPEHSQMVAGAATDNLSSVVLQYRSRLIDGTEVFQEVYCKPRQGAVHDDMPRRGPEQPPVGHHDCINDIAITKLPQNFIISAGRDGVIKIWK